ncbi:hypothetical protein [Acinetobacter soli]|uniref:hypothetical protein n=1 Tax=Acinetobacter soli TaxID=487316 RepID=UPI000DCF7575|nr:hypothetical protein [Acinetobacter soli]
MKKVFISGSIAIKALPECVLLSLDKMMQNNLEILVGDASGIDEQIQKYFSKHKYKNVTVYSIYNQPRNLNSSNFKVKVIDIEIESNREREKQKEKDKAMTNDSEYSLVIWDGKSKGSYSNILRSLEQKKAVKVYLDEINDFIEKDKITVPEIEYIYRKNNGYTAQEIVEYLLGINITQFKNTRDLNKYLIEKKIIAKEESIYIPVMDKNFFIIETYQGKVSGLKFTNEFIQWFEQEIKTVPHFEQDDMFG